MRTQGRYQPDEVAQLLGLFPPTEEQAAVIQAPLEPAVVIAGAGSGKTETMAARVVWLVANELVAPDRILGLTFTRKAAGELQHRIRARLKSLNRALGRGSDAGEPTVLTYAAYSGRLVQEHGIVLGCEPGSRLLFYTDARSPKVAQIAACPRAALMVWSPRLGWQVRMRARLAVETGGRINAAKAVSP